MFCACSNFMPKTMRMYIGIDSNVYTFLEYEWTRRDTNTKWIRNFTRNLRYRTWIERKTNTTCEGLKLWHEYYTVSDAVQSDSCPGIPWHARILAESISFTYSQWCIHNSHNVIYNLQANEHETQFEVSFECLSFLLPCSRHWGVFGTMSCLLPICAASVFIPRRIHFLIIYICSLERMLWLRKYQINGQLEPATDPLHCRTHSLAVKQRND